METHFPMGQTGEEASQEKMATELKSVVEGAEELVKATAGDTSEKIKHLRARLAVTLENAKVTYRKFEEKAVAGAKATDKVIREHPYESIGVGFGLGLLIGVLINRK